MVVAYFMTSHSLIKCTENILKNLRIVEKEIEFLLSRTQSNNDNQSAAILTLCVFIAQQIKHGTRSVTIYHYYPYTLITACHAYVSPHVSRRQSSAGYPCISLLPIYCT